MGAAPARSLSTAAERRVGGCYEASSGCCSESTSGEAAEGCSKLNRIWWQPKGKLTPVFRAYPHPCAHRHVVMSCNTIGNCAQWSCTFCFATTLGLPRLAVLARTRLDAQPLYTPRFCDPPPRWHLERTATHRAYSTGRMPCVCWTSSRVLLRFDCSTVYEGSNAHVC